jgi:cytochrome c
MNVLHMKLFSKSVGALVLIAVLCGCDQKSKRMAASMTGGDPDKGKSDMRQHGCSSCHTIPGVPGAKGLVGPPLSQMASRVYIGGVLKNTPDNMVRWLKDPPGVDPMTAMPNLHLSERDARDLASFIYTLK